MTTVVVSPTGVLSFPEGGGHWWVYLQYVLGLRDLGCDVWWLERLPAGTPRPTTALRRLARFGLADRVLAYEADATGAPAAWVAGDDGALDRLATRADLLLNFDYRAGAPVVGRFERTALVDIDPGLLQQWMSVGQLTPATHDRWFTTGETVGTPDAAFPDAGVTWRRIRPIVHLPSWPCQPDPPTRPYTTVTSWWGDEWITDGAGLLYENNKRVTFLHVADLPRRSGVRLELAAYFGDSGPTARAGAPDGGVEPGDGHRSGPGHDGRSEPAGARAGTALDHAPEVRPEQAAGDATDVERMLAGGWRLRRSRDVAGDPWAYRRYVQQSRGEVSCVKPSCLALQNAWISDRTLCYLASGRPAVVQHTGPSRLLPDAAGLIRFRSPDEAVDALRMVESDYRTHATAARELAASLFDASPVLTRLLDDALSTTTPHGALHGTTDLHTRERTG